MSVPAPFLVSEAGAPLSEMRPLSVTSPSSCMTPAPSRTMLIWLLDCASFSVPPPVSVTAPVPTLLSSMMLSTAPSTRVPPV